MDTLSSQMEREEMESNKSIDCIRIEPTPFSLGTHTLFAADETKMIDFDLPISGKPILTTLTAYSTAFKM